VEVAQVHGGLVELDGVPAGAARDAAARGGGQRGAQPREVAAERGPGALRRVLAPDPRHEAVDADGVVGVDQQRGEHEPLPRGTQVDLTAVGARGYLAEQSELGAHARTPFAAATSTQPKWDYVVQRSAAD
jgi:hypothetical protein